MPTCDSNWGFSNGKRLSYHCATLAMITEVFTTFNKILTATMDVMIHSKRLVVEYNIENGKFQNIYIFLHFLMSYLHLFEKKKDKNAAIKENSYNKNFLSNKFLIKKNYYKKIIITKYSYKKYNKKKLVPGLGLNHQPYG